MKGLEEISFHVPLSYTIPLANEKQVNKVLNYLSKSKHPGIKIFFLIV